MTQNSPTESDGEIYDTPEPARAGLDRVSYLEGVFAGALVIGLSPFVGIALTHDQIAILGAIGFVVSLVWEVWSDE